MAVQRAQLGPSPHRPAGPALAGEPALSDDAAWELATVSDDGAVLFRGSEVEVVDGLAPGSDHIVRGVAFRTLARPPGARLATVATVNDVHFGETRAGHFDGMEVEPVLSSPPGARPYPEVMNAAAAAEIAALHPDAVVAKGDLTAEGDPAEYAAFEACYRPLLGARLHVTRGNHDNQAAGAAFDCPPVQAVEVPGATLAILDTSRPGQGGGALDAAQLDWLDELAARADRPVLAFGHHPAWEDRPGDWVGEGSTLDPASTAGLLDVVGRRRAVVGWFAGHTHRNRVRRFAATGEVPFVEVACVKDFPGSWAEYRVFEGGALQVHHRIAAPEALSWSEACRALVWGLYPRYAFGDLDDRCFVLPTPWG